MQRWIYCVIMKSWTKHPSAAISTLITSHHMSSSSNQNAVKIS